MLWATSADSTAHAVTLQDPHTELRGRRVLQRSVWHHRRVLEATCAVRDRHGLAHDIGHPLVRSVLFNERPTSERQEQVELFRPLNDEERRAKRLGKAGVDE